MYCNYHETHPNQIRQWEQNGFVYIPGNILNSPEDNVFFMLDTYATRHGESLLYRFSPNGYRYVSRCWIKGNLFVEPRELCGRRWQRQALMNYGRPHNTIKENLQKYLKTAVNYRRRLS